MPAVVVVVVALFCCFWHDEKIMSVCVLVVCVVVVCGVWRVLPPHWHFFSG